MLRTQAPRKTANLRYLFEDYALDTDRRELRRGAEVIPVAAQVFDLLDYLIRNRERVVSKDDLLTAIWDGRIVSDGALTTRMKVARGVIGDNGREQHLIKTLPRKGFRFVGAVQEEQGSSAATETSMEAPRAALAPPDKPSVAVLPFTNMSGEAAQDYFADGITDDIITELSRFSELFVIAGNSSFQYKGKAIDVRKIGRELGVGYVLEGSIRRDGDRVRVGAQLIDALTGAHRWAERYERELMDVFAVQDEVARGIVTTLAVHVSKAEAQRTLLKPPATWQAHDNYLRAVDILASFWSSLKKEDLYETRRLLERALAIDPNYARAYAGLSFAQIAAWTVQVDTDYLAPAALDRAHEFARKALQLDPNLPQARVCLGVVLGWKHQHEAAITEFERAIALNPNFTQWRFVPVLVFAGQPARAIEIGQAHMRLDPFYLPLVPAWLGLAHYMLKRYADALPLLQECISRAPNYRGAHVWAAATYARLDKLEEARAEVAEVLRIEPSYTIEETARRVSVFFKHPKDADHLFDGLRKAGLPEK
jgi:adenylate cyclase